MTLIRHRHLTRRRWVPACAGTTGLLFRRALVALAMIAATWAALATAQGTTATAPVPPALRLPDGARPLRYALTLTVVPGQDKARGEIAIDIELAREHAVLWLNADALTVTNAAVAGRTSPIRVLSGHEHFVGFAFDPPLPAGRHRLALSYEAEQSRNSTRGIFALQDAGAWYAMTHFEPTSARRAFPCFDEPSFKVPWQLTLRVPRDTVAFSNTFGVDEPDDEAGMKRVRFRETRPLPSYLVAFAVGPWETVNLRRVGTRPTPMRVIVPKGRRADASFAAGAYPPIFELTERWFGIAHPYEKLDHIAIPLTVGFAMENAGLITYGAPTLLAKPGGDVAKVPTRRGEHRRARDRAPVVRQSGEPDVVGRPLAQRGVRDLVRGKDRRPLAAGVRARHGARARARRRDEGGRARYCAAHPRADRRRMATSAQRSIRSPTRRARRSSACSKPGSASTCFAAASSSYLRARSDGNATTGDFLDALSAASRRPVGPAFSTFLDQNGVPQVAVTLDCANPRQADALARATTAPAGRRGGGAGATLAGPGVRSLSVRRDHEAGVHVANAKRRQRCPWQGRARATFSPMPEERATTCRSIAATCSIALRRNRASLSVAGVHERSLRPACAGARRIGGRGGGARMGPCNRGFARPARDARVDRAGELRARYAGRRGRSRAIRRLRARGFRSPRASAGLPAEAR